MLIELLLAPCSQGGPPIIQPPQGLLSCVMEQPCDWAIRGHVLWKQKHYMF